MKLEEAKALYEGENPEGEVVLHSKDRRSFDKELLQRRLTDIYITFAGPPVPEGYAAIFPNMPVDALPDSEVWT